MSDYAQTATPGVSVKVSIDWTELGAHIADASSEEQATFLEAWANTMSVWFDDAYEMQLGYVGNEMNDPDADYSLPHIRRLLEGILTRISS
ncbi:hypothetical protein GCM10009775_04320 [Microbacterium aoyamense]|uniref:Uncharacterized protein n=1 Tax=Microbacterium aoyamense TaxID=344166 RepID=A0ABN2P9V8_9MICO|nr:hypothetical protein [Microbacterium aoyamense]